MIIIIIRMMKLKSIIWVERVVRVGKSERRNHWEELDVGGWITTKLDLRWGWYSLDSSDSG
jgi:hypothetical protein